MPLFANEVTNVEYYERYGRTLCMCLGPLAVCGLMTLGLTLVDRCLSHRHARTIFPWHKLTGKKQHQLYVMQVKEWLMFVQHEAALQPPSSLLVSAGERQQVKKANIALPRAVKPTVLELSASAFSKSQTTTQMLEQLQTQRLLGVPMSAESFTPATVMGLEHVTQTLYPSALKMVAPYYVGPRWRPLDPQPPAKSFFDTLPASGGVSRQECLQRLNIIHGNGHPLVSGQKYEAKSEVKALPSMTRAGRKGSTA